MTFTQQIESWIEIFESKTVHIHYYMIDSNILQFLYNLFLFLCIFSYFFFCTRAHSITLQKKHLKFQ